MTETGKTQPSMPAVEAPPPQTEREPSPIESLAIILSDLRTLKKITRDVFAEQQISNQYREALATEIRDLKLQLQIQEAAQKARDEATEKRVALWNPWKVEVDRDRKDLRGEIEELKRRIAKLEKELAGANADDAVDGLVAAADVEIAKAKTETTIAVVRADVEELKAAREEGEKDGKRAGKREGEKAGKVKAAAVTLGALALPVTLGVLRLIELLPDVVHALRSAHP